MISCITNALENYIILKPKEMQKVQSRILTAKSCSDKQNNVSFETYLSDKFSDCLKIIHRLHLSSPSLGRLKK